VLKCTNKAPNIYQTCFQVKYKKAYFSPNKKHLLGYFSSIKNILQKYTYILTSEMIIELLSSYIFVLYSDEHDYACSNTTDLVMHQKATPSIYKFYTTEYKLDMVSCIFTADYPHIILCNQKCVWLLKSGTFRCTSFFIAPYLCNHHLQESPELQNKKAEISPHIIICIVRPSHENKIHSPNPEILMLREKSHVDRLY
jgi:hypothetical protein